MRRLVRLAVLAAPLLFSPFLFAGGIASATTLHARADSDVVRYEVNPDLTYVETSESDTTVFTQRGIDMYGRRARTFYPDKQSLEVLEAWVDQPDGARIEVPESSRFTRPSAASQSAPGFVGSFTTTIVFPQLREGSHTHVKFRLIQKTPPLNGFNAFNMASYETAAVEDRVEINIPADVRLQWRSRGMLPVSDTTDDDGIRHIVARMKPVAGEDPERNSVSETDFLPVFVATTLPSMAAIGAEYYHQSEGKTEVTPELAALAAKIAGDRTGLDAARAIYDWVAGNIRYVAVYLDVDDGWIPHSAEEVLHNGYGDCKDHVAIMQALLAARGIAAEAALVEWGERFRDLPLWSPYQFNHAIVYLPAYDRYLNPTNPYASFDTLDAGLAGKTVAVATPTGRVARTPDSLPANHLYALDAHVAVAADGTIDGRSAITASPNVDSTIRGAVASAASSRDLVERILASTAEGGEGDLHTSNPRDLSTPLAVSATWESSHGVVFQGMEAYMQVSLGPDIERAASLRRYLSPSGSRRTPLFIGARDLTWSSTIVVPPGTAVARLPANIDLRTEAGSYSATYERVGRDVHVVRHLVVDRNVYEADAYAELQRLLFAPIDDARAVIVLARNEAAN